MCGWLRAAGAAAAAGVIAAVVLLSVRQVPWLASWQPVGVYALLWVVFAAGAWLVLGVGPRRAVPLIVLGGIAIQLAALSASPQGSSDLYRYIWDGRVQLAGIDPYHYAPAAPQLTGLRDQFLWPPDGTYCVGMGGLADGPHAVVTSAPVRPRRDLLPRGCTLINRPRVPTIYPPVAEAYYTVVSALSWPGSGSVPIQAAAALCAVATTVLLVRGLQRLGRDPRYAVFWAWCPVVGLQAGNDAHVDVLAAFLAAAALLTLARPGGNELRDQPRAWLRLRARARVRAGLRAICGGVLLGLAIATKITPVLLAPAVLRRRPVAVAASALAATCAVYLPHVVAVGSHVIGFLPGYLAQDGYTSGGRFELVSLVVPGRWATLAAVLILAGAGLVVLRRADPDRPWHAAVLMTGAALAVTTPALLWYSMLLVMLVALDGRPEWLALAAARYFTPVHPLPGRTMPYAGQLGYALAVAFVVTVTLLRWRAARKHGPDAGEEPPEPAEPTQSAESAEVAEPAALAPSAAVAGLASGWLESAPLGSASLGRRRGMRSPAVGPMMTTAGLRTGGAASGSARPPSVLRKIR